MSLKNKLLTYSLCLLTLAGAQSASAAEGASFAASPAYQECATLAASDPEAALAKADSWLKIDDSVAAHHCRAMALYGLKHYDKAASELDGVRLKIDPADIAMRAYVTRQTARAWVSASKPENALHVLGEQVNEMTMTRGDNVTQAKLATDLLLDRSRIRMNYGQLAEAVQDLDQAISLSPGNEDVLVERAKIFAQLGDNALAQRDLQVVLRMNPKHAEAIGLMRVLRDTHEKK
jgi:tetratricopeptide (TPR) repeat protein